MATIGRKRASDTPEVAGGMARSLSNNNNNKNDDTQNKKNGNAGETTTTIRRDDTNPKIQLRVRIKQFHGVARWTWNVNGEGNGEAHNESGGSSTGNGMTTDGDDVCGICQSAFEGCPPGVKFPGDESPVVFGVCGHAFHLQCVATWLNSSRQTCPICRADWEYGNSRNSTTTSTSTSTNVSSSGGGNGGGRSSGEAAAANGNDTNTATTGGN